MDEKIEKVKAELSDDEMAKISGGDSMDDFRAYVDSCPFHSHQDSCPKFVCRDCGTAKVSESHMCEARSKITENICDRCVHGLRVEIDGVRGIACGDWT